MTSTASQNPVPNTSATTATSYASAAGANTKPTIAPVIATGSNHAPVKPVVVGSSVQLSRNGSPLNGVGPRPSAPAIPVIVNGAAGHGHKHSVTFGSDGRGLISGLNTAKPDFMYHSPVPDHAVPATRPVESPSSSPRPIPIPQHSGGRVGPLATPSTQGIPQFGSFGDRQSQAGSYQNSLPNSYVHGRRDSQVSLGASDMVPIAATRGGYQQGRGRGYGSQQQFNNHQNMGYPPTRQYGGPNSTRGGIGHYSTRGGMQPYPISPQPARTSPAMAPAVPHGTPNMPPSAMAPGFFYPPSNVKPPLTQPEFSSHKSSKKGKAVRRAEKVSRHGRAQNSSQQEHNDEFGGKDRRYSKRLDSNYQDSTSSPQLPDFSGPSHYDFVPGPLDMFPPDFGPIDLSPETGAFEKAKLMAKFPQMSSPFSGLDPYGRPLFPYSNYPQSMQAYGPPHQNTQYPQQFMPYGPNPSVAPSMSRNSSQVSSVAPADQRPVSSTGPPQSASSVTNTPGQRPAQPVAPAIVSSSAFTRPRRNQAIPIKNPSGEVVDFSKNGPVSPAPSLQQAKTPPAMVSTFTPPLKVSTPTHARHDSSAGAKTAVEKQHEFKEAILRAAAADTPSDMKTTEDETTKAAHEEVVTEETGATLEADKVSSDAKAREKRAAEQAAAANVAAEKAAADQTAAQEKAASEEKAKREERAREEQRLVAEKKAAEETEAAAKAQAARDAKTNEDTEKEAEKQADKQAEKEAKSREESAQPAPSAQAAAAAGSEQDWRSKDPADMTEAELDLMFAEMEEKDRVREAEQAKKNAEIKARKEEKKKKQAEAEKLVSPEEKDRKLREQEAEMTRLEEERERKREQKAGQEESLAELLSKNVGELKAVEGKTADVKDATPTATNDKEEGGTTGIKAGNMEKQRMKPPSLNLAPINTKSIEAPQPSAALQSLKSARFLMANEQMTYPQGVMSPNPALNAAVSKKGKSFKYDAQFLLQFQGVFTEQPSIEFVSQVKSLIGDPERSASARTPLGAGRQSSKVGAAGTFPVGSILQNSSYGTGRTLPPGTTSEQRFRESHGQSMAPARIPSQVGFGRAFPSGNPMSRTPSGTGPLPSPRTGSKRAGSRRDYKQDAQAAKTMPLTAGVDLKPIAVTASGWKPTSVGNRAGQSVVSGQGHMDPEMVQRKVKAALNKMTPEKFDKIADQILLIASQSKNETDGRTLRQVIQLTFEKATDEAHWASMYARFCRLMLDQMSNDIKDENILDKAGQLVCGGALFRKYLLNRCQEEFERGWKVDLPAPKDGEDKKAGEAVLLSDEYYIAAAAKRRGLGLVQFIGELFKLGMLTERIMHECVRKLLEFHGVPDEAEIESLVKLLRTIGGTLDNAEKSRPMMEVYFSRIYSIVELPELPSRLKFMLMDIVDLRKARWESKDGVSKGPKTLDEIRHEAEAQQAAKAQESARNNQRVPGGRQNMGRGDPKQFSYNQPAPNQLAPDELRRMKGMSSRSTSQNHAAFGPTSNFNSRSNSGRRPMVNMFGRAGEDSNASSRTGTPPTRERDSTTHTNAFALLANDTGDHPTSPPSASASPAISKAALDTATSTDKKEG